MTTKVISVYPETMLTEATKLITEHNFDGLPVISKDGHLVGILTEYDLINKTSSLSASFLERILSDIYTTKEEDGSDDKKTVAELTVQDIMNPEPLTLTEDATLEEVIQTFRSHHRVNPIPIVNSSRQVVGIISRFDVLRPLNIIVYGNKK